MFDTFLQAADQAAMQAALPAEWWQVPESEPGVPNPAAAWWFPNWPGCQLMPPRADMSPMKWIETPAEWDHSDPENPVLTQPEVIKPGFFLWLSDNSISDISRWDDMPQRYHDLGDIVQLVTDRDMWSRTPNNPNYMVYINPNQDLQDCQPSPILAGVNYPFRDMPAAWWDRPNP